MRPRKVSYKVSLDCEAQKQKKATVVVVSFLKLIVVYDKLIIGTIDVTACMHVVFFPSHGN